MGGAHEMFREDKRGVGATSEAMIEPLTPLIDYYAREMGELPGRLMMAIGFLDDAQLTAGWSAQTPEAHQAVKQARPGRLSDDQGMPRNDVDAMIRVLWPQRRRVFSTSSPAVTGISDGSKTGISGRQR